MLTKGSCIGLASPQVGGRWERQAVDQMERTETFLSHLLGCWPSRTALLNPLLHMLVQRTGSRHTKVYSFSCDWFCILSTNVNQ